MYAKMNMKYTNVRIILIIMLALIFITTEAQETGATGTNDSTGRSVATGSDEAQAENDKKMKMQHTVANVKNNAVKEIKGVVDTAISETKKYASEQKQACTVEETAAIQWSKEADPVATEAARKKRKKAKEELLSAIEYRQKVLKKFLDKLYAARYTLGDSIHRTNNIYFSAYDANVQTQVITRNALKFLGIAFEHKNSGAFGVFHPIKLPNLHDDEVQEEAAEKKEGIVIDQSPSETSAREADETTKPPKKEEDTIKAKKQECSLAFGGHYSEEFLRRTTKNTFHLYDKYNGCIRWGGGEPVVPKVIMMENCLLKKFIFMVKIILPLS